MEEKGRQASGSDSDKIVMMFLLGCLIIFVIFIGIVVKTDIDKESKNDTTIESYRIVSKEWTYNISIGTYEVQHGVNSYDEPPKEAKNVESRLVQQMNGCFRKLYTYDLIILQDVRTVEITGGGSKPTFNEYQETRDGEQIVSKSTPIYYVKVKTGAGDTKKINVSEKKWLELKIGVRYLSNQF